MKNHKAEALIIGLLALVQIIIPAAAIYDFEGIPLDIVAQGEVRGELVTGGTYGLVVPPVECTVALPANPVWARAYTGIWGGTEQYSGWAGLEVNGQAFRYTLAGVHDANPGVFASGHGIYWIAEDVTGCLQAGENLLRVTTSRGEAASKLDGRVYALCLVALVEDPDGPVVQYWVAEGCENLHGEGWAGTNPTRKDRIALAFPGGLADGVTDARLSLVLLATAAGQPDYVSFNGVDLGAGDIGNERSFDAEGGAGTASRYTDAEEFVVSGHIAGVNEVSIERGRDIDGDGTIATSGAGVEGEDYLHPCLVTLALTRPDAVPAPDVAVESVNLADGYAGESGSIVAEVKNYGSPPANGATVTFYANDRPVGSRQVTLDYSGMARVELPWTVPSGTVTLAAEVAAAGDRNPSNNRGEATVAIGTAPDLAVSVGEPVHAGDPVVPAPTSSPLSAGAVISGVLGCLLLVRLRPPRKMAPALFMIAMIVAVPFLMAVPGSAGTYGDYHLPVTVANEGGSPAGGCTVTVMIDGEKVAVKEVTETIGGGSRLELAIPVYTTPGTHTVAVLVDGEVDDEDPVKENNRWEGARDFP